MPSPYPPMLSYQISSSVPTQILHFRRTCCFQQEAPPLQASPRSRCMQIRAVHAMTGGDKKAFSLSRTLPTVPETLEGRRACLPPVSSSVDLKSSRLPLTDLCSLTLTNHRRRVSCWEFRRPRSVSCWEFHLLKINPTYCSRRAASNLLSYRR